MTDPHRFFNLLFVALNEDTEPPACFPEAVEFARSTNSSMTLFDAVPPVPRLQRPVRIGYKQIGETDYAAVVRREQLQGWADEHRSRLRMGVAVSAGRRSVEVAHRARAASHDLVIVAPSGSGGDDLAVVRRLIRVVPCAILVLRGPVREGAVIGAVDPDDQLSLNVMVASTASGIARIGERDLHLVHAYEPHGVRLMRAANFAHLGDADIQSFVDRSRDAHRDALAELVQRLAVGGTVITHVDVGSPLEVIARSVVEFEASIVTVGAGGRRGMPPMLIGGTADRVVSRTAASVLIVKPPGFVPNLDEHDDAWSASAGPTAIVTACS